MAAVRRNSPLISAGMALGIGLGGFFDGIFFHQIFQTHNMMSAVRPSDSVVNIEINMFWDGLFHLFCWLFTLLGVILLFNAARWREVVGCWSGKTLLGSMLMGWGLFNLIEGIIDHHILGIHHVIERLGLSVWDYVFLGSGVIFMGAGLALICAARTDDSSGAFAGQPRITSS